MKKNVKIYLLWFKVRLGVSGRLGVPERAKSLQVFFFLAPRRCPDSFATT
jgi:hypothetical protein